jgi:ATP phosphoribosyltransferase regulatory subunit
VVFAASSERLPSAIALGGRYDEVGKAFGRARPATGFSMDLREIARVAPRAQRQGAILAPYTEDAALRSAVDALREKGEIVIVDLPGHESARAS